MEDQLGFWLGGRLWEVVTQGFSAVPRPQYMGIKVGTLQILNIAKVYFLVLADTYISQFKTDSSLPLQLYNLTPLPALINGNLLLSKYSQL